MIKIEEFKTQWIIFRESTRIAKAYKWPSFLFPRLRDHPPRLLARVFGQLFIVVHPITIVSWSVSNRWAAPELIGILTRAEVLLRKLPEQKFWSSMPMRKTITSIQPSLFERQISTIQKKKEEKALFNSKTEISLTKSFKLLYFKSICACVTSTGSV